MSAHPTSFKLPVMSLFVRAPFSYDADKVSQDTGLKCLDDSLTVQSEKDDCDINTLVKRFKLTGEMPQVDRLPANGDFTGVVDYHSAMNAIIEADDVFMSLPADTRSRFNHDAGYFVAFCSDAKNLPELREMGLAKPAEAPLEPLPVRVIADVPKP